MVEGQVNQQTFFLQPVARYIFLTQKVFQILLASPRIIKRLEALDISTFQNYSLHLFLWYTNNLGDEMTFWIKRKT